MLTLIHSTTKVYRSRRLNAWAVKAAKFAIRTHFQFVFNTYISQNVFPENLKLAFNSPVYKKGDVKIYENYRPISVTPMFAKFFERLLLNQVNEIIQYKILNGTQFGFQKQIFYRYCFTLIRSITRKL